MIYCLLNSYDKYVLKGIKTMQRNLTLEEVILDKYNIQINVQTHSIGMGDKGYDYGIYNPKNGRSWSSDIDGERLETDVLWVVYLD